MHTDMEFGFVCTDGVLRDHKASHVMLQKFDGTNGLNKKQVYRVVSVLAKRVDDLCLRTGANGLGTGANGLGTSYMEVDADTFDKSPNKSNTFCNKRKKMQNSPLYLEGLKHPEYYSGESAKPAAKQLLEKDMILL